MARWTSFAAVLALTAAFARAATVFENEAVRIEFQEIGEVSSPDTEVPLRFKLENRGTARLGGTLDVGGPTRGILPRNEPSQPFKVEPGATAELEMKVAFAPDCVDGFYPVHAFFLFQEGRGDRAILTRLVRPGFAARNPDAREPQLPALARFRAAPVDNAVDRFFEERRLAVMADYARSLDGSAGRAYRLGTEEGAFRVLFAPGRQGMLDGYLYLSGPKSDIFYRGLRVTMLAPEGVSGSETIEVENYREERRENGFFATHQIRLGEWESILDVEVAIAGREVRIRCDSPDPVLEVSLGEVSIAPRGLTAGAGYRFADPDAVEIDGDSPLLDVRAARFEFDGGLRVVMGCDEPLAAIRAIRSDHHASVAVAGRQWLRLVPGLEELPPMAMAPPQPAPKPDGRKLPAIWLQRDCRSPVELEREVREWGRCEAGPLGLLLDRWQAGAQEPVPPDAWPPNDAAGGVVGLSRLAEVCREAGVTLALADRYQEISPLSRGFQFDVVEFGAAGRPSDIRPGLGYAMRPDAAPAYFEENWKQIQFHVKPGAAFLGGVDAAGHEFWDRDGRAFPASWVRERWRANVSKARELAGESTLLLAAGGGDWLAGLTDAIVAPPPGPLPPRAVRVPWWILFPSGRTPLIEPFPGDPGAVPAAVGEFLADARLPLFGDATWMHEALERSWFMQPVLERFRGRQVEGLREEENGKHLTVYWGTGLVVRRNAGDKPWALERTVVPPGGFWVEGAGIRAGTEVVDGVLCQRLETPEERALSPLHPDARLCPVRVAVENLSQLSEDRVELALRWHRPELAPPGSLLRVYLVSRRQGTVTPWGDEGFDIGEAGPARLLLPAGAVPADQEREVAVAIENAGQRRLRLLDRTEADEDPALFRVGRIKRVPGAPPQWETSWRTEQEWPGGPQLRSAAPPVDVGWAVSQGAFRLKKTGAAWRLHPLPCQPEFEIRLRIAQIDGFLPQVGKITGLPRKTGEPVVVPFRVENGCVVFRAGPDILAYAFAAEPAPAPAPAAAAASNSAPDGKPAPPAEGAAPETPRPKRAP